MRIAAGTGILVRATAKARGPARELLLEILAGGHILLVSPFLLEQIKRVLNYPRMQKLYSLTNDEIESFIELLQDAAELVTPSIAEPVVFSDPTDDPIVYTAVDGRADVLCAMDRDFYRPSVVAFCRQRGIEIMNDVELLRELRS